MADLAASFNVIKDQIGPLIGKLGTGNATPAEIEQLRQLVKQLPPDLGNQISATIEPQIAAAAQDQQLGGQSNDILQKILDQAGATRAENNQFFDSNVLPELDKARGAATDASYMERMGLQKQDATRNKLESGYSDLTRKAAETALGYNKQAQGLQDQLAATYGGLDTSDRAALDQYQQETNPLMQALKAGGYGADVQADAEGLGAQRDVMQRYKDLSNPEATAQERYLSEIARRNFEAQDRGNREAVMQDLSQRGLQSGTLQIANNLASQERLGQDRTLAELGLQANAVGRSMQALQGYGGQANALRSANDAINMFNKDQSQVSQRFADQFAAEEATRVGNLAGNRQKATADTNAGIGTRAMGLTTSGKQTINDNSYRDREARDTEERGLNEGYKADTTYNNAFGALGQNDYNRQMGILGGATSAAGTRSGIATGGSNNQLEALKLALGQTEAERALIAQKRLT